MSKVDPDARSECRKITNEAWVLPRPRLNRKYKGGFPMHFEKRILRRLALTPADAILHPFGGAAEYGLRIDIKADTKPDIVADAHHLPIRDGVMQVVIVDPPYNKQYAEQLYDTAKLGPLRFSRYTEEAVRVLAPGGYLVMYHFLTTPRIPGTDLIRRIFVETRVWHSLRSVKIHRKHGSHSSVQSRLGDSP